jgi:hypothetical protein
MQDLIKPETLSHGPGCVHAHLGETLEVVFADRLHLGGRRSNAAKL